MKRFILTICAAVLCVASMAATKSYTLLSPDGRLSVDVQAGEQLTYALHYDGEQVLQPSALALHLTDGTVLGEQCRVLKVHRRSVNEKIASPLYFKSEVCDHYNALSLDLHGGVTVEFRAYDEGAAYRFITQRKEPFKVEREVVEYNFGAPHKTWIAYANLVNYAKISDKHDPFVTSFENKYHHITLPEVKSDSYAFTPVVVDMGSVKVCIAESNVQHYPGTFVYNPDGSNSLKGIAAPLPKIVKQGGYNKLQGVVHERYPYIAECVGASKLPWRIAIVAQNDYELLNNDMVYRLAEPSRLSDISWIRPGKVAWEWWNHWGLRGVDFEAGINTATYKEYINFAADNDIEYIILDEGWATRYKNDLMDVVPSIDLPAIVEYGRSKGVGVILWAGYNALCNDAERICEHYSKMGIKGFKIDFLDRDDADMIDYMYRIAEITARHKMVIDFHGCTKPAGLNRTYPNVLNFEGVMGLETMKFGRYGESTDMPRNDVILPYLRMVAGPIDYTQGAMRNANKKNFRAISAAPMSQGTRVHQMALYAIFVSPLSMMCDSPSNYRDEQECTDFIASFPVVWEQTVPLDGKIGEYVAMARRKGESWYVGAVTSWEPRTLTLDLSKVLGEGDYRAEVFRDGANAHQQAEDYVHEHIDIPANRHISISLAPGGGYVMKITKR